MIAFS